MKPRWNWRGGNYSNETSRTGHVRPPVNFNIKAEGNAKYRSTTMRVYLVQITMYVCVDRRSLSATIREKIDLE